MPAGRRAVANATKPRPLSNFAQHVLGEGLDAIERLLARRAQKIEQDMVNAFRYGILGISDIHIGVAPAIASRTVGDAFQIAPARTPPP